MHTGGDALLCGSLESRLKWWCCGEGTSAVSVVEAAYSVKSVLQVLLCMFFYSWWWYYT